MREALGRLEGVRSAELDFPNRKVTLTVAQERFIRPEDVRAALRSGFTMRTYRITAEGTISADGTWGDGRECHVVRFLRNGASFPLLPRVVERGREAQAQAPFETIRAGLAAGRSRFRVTGEITLSSGSETESRPGQQVMTFWVLRPHEAVAVVPPGQDR